MLAAAAAAVPDVLLDTVVLNITNLKEVLELEEEEDCSAVFY